MNNLNLKSTKILNIYEELNLGIIVKNSGDKIVYVNNKIIEFFKISLSVNDLLGKEFKEVLRYLKLFTKDEISFETEVDKLIKTKNKGEEVIIQLKNGKTFKQKYLTIEENDSVVNEVFIYEDISEKIYLREKLLELTIYDNLTKVFNRKKLKEEMHKYMQLSRRYDNKLAIAIFDVDNFKDINNRLGEEEGDNVLVRISNIVNKRKRAVDVFGRLGGGEFIIILPETDIKGAKTFSEYLKSKISDMILDDSDNKVTVSFGLTIYNENEDENVDQVIKRAYTALEKAKENGKNNVVVYELILTQI
jgi:diguanylate cyclase (GGDEF)-like protein